MAEVDYVIPALNISSECIFNMTELYRMMKRWFDHHNYDFYEKEYLDKEHEEARSFNIKWEAERKVDDYVKFHIEVRIKGSNIKDVKLKKTKACKGKIAMKFEAFLEKDYEDNWEKNFFLKFVRGCYDQFIARDKFVRYSHELSDETYDVFNKVKAFLKLQQYKA